MSDPAAPPQSLRDRLDAYLRAGGDPSRLDDDAWAPAGGTAFRDKVVAFQRAGGDVRKVGLPPMVPAPDAPAPPPSVDLRNARFESGMDPATGRPLGTVELAMNAPLYAALEIGKTAWQGIKEPWQAWRDYNLEIQERQRQGREQEAADQLRRIQEYVPGGPRGAPIDSPPEIHQPTVSPGAPALPSLGQYGARGVRNMVESGIGAVVSPVVAPVATPRRLLSEAGIRSGPLMAAAQIPEAAALMPAWEAYGEHVVKPAGEQFGDLGAAAAELAPFGFPGAARVARESIAKPLALRYPQLGKYALPRALGFDELAASAALEQGQSPVPVPPEMLDSRPGRPFLSPEEFLRLRSEVAPLAERPQRGHVARQGPAPFEPGPAPFDPRSILPGFPVGSPTPMPPAVPPAPVETRPGVAEFRPERVERVPAVVQEPVASFPNTPKGRLSAEELVARMERSSQGADVGRIEDTSGGLGAAGPTVVRDVPGTVPVQRRADLGFRERVGPKVEPPQAPRPEPPSAPEQREFRGKTAKADADAAVEALNARGLMGQHYRVEPGVEPQTNQRVYRIVTDTEPAPPAPMRERGLPQAPPKPAAPVEPPKPAEAPQTPQVRSVPLDVLDVGSEGEAAAWGRPPRREGTVPTRSEQALAGRTIEQVAADIGPGVETFRAKDGSEFVFNPSRLPRERLETLDAEGRVWDAVNGEGTSPKPAAPREAVVVKEPTTGAETRTVLTETPEQTQAAVKAQPPSADVAVEPATPAKIESVLRERGVPREPESAPLPEPPGEEPARAPAVEAAPAEAPREAPRPVAEPAAPPVREPGVARPEATGEPGSEGTWPVADMEIRPDVFQFKQAVDAKGQTGALKHIEKPGDWRRTDEGVVTAWKDAKGEIGPAGKVYVTDGHQRWNAASRAGVERMRVQFSEARTAAEARLEAAEMNLRAGSVEPVDAARFFREVGKKGDELATYMREHQISPKRSTVKSGRALANLPDDLWNEYLQGRLREDRAIAIGETGLSPEQMRAVAELDIPAEQVWSAANRVREAGVKSEGGGGLFGEDPVQKNLVSTELALESELVKSLAQDKRVFGFAAKRAGELERVGELDAAEAKKIADESGTVAEVARKLLQYRGPLRDAVTAAARDVAEKRMTRSAAVARLRDEAKRILVEEHKELKLSEPGAPKPQEPAPMPEGGLFGAEPEPAKPKPEPVKEQGAPKAATTGGSLKRRGGKQSGLASLDPIVGIYNLTQKAIAGREIANRALSKLTTKLAEKISGATPDTVRGVRSTLFDWSPKRESPEYAQAVRDLETGVRTGKIDTVDVFSKFERSLRGNNLTAADRNAVRRYMTSEIEAGELPSHVQSNGRLMAEIDGTSAFLKQLEQELVSRKLLSRNAAAQYVRYLPRLFAEEQAGLMGSLTRLGGTRARVVPNYLREDKFTLRFKAGSKIAQERIERLVADQGGFAVTRKGRVYQAKFNTAEERAAFRDAARRHNRSMKRDGETGQNLRYVSKFDPLPEELRLSKGEIENPTHLGTYAAMRAFRKIAEHDFLESLTRGSDAKGAWTKKLSSPKDPVPPGYVKLEESWAGPVQWKRQRPIVVRDSIAADLKGTFGGGGDLTPLKQAQEFMTGLSEGYVSQVKAHLTSYSPPTLMRQFPGNAFFLHLGGVNPLNPANWRTILDAVRNMKTEGKGSLNYDARRLGILDDANYSAQELNLFMERAKTPRQGARELGRRLTGNPLLFSERGRALDASLARVYMTPDNLTRMILFTHFVKNLGMEPRLAAVEVNKYVPNYREVGPAVQLLRKSPVGSPFLTFRYEVARIALNAMRENPVRFLDSLLMLQALKEAGKLASGSTDEEEDAISQEKGYWLFPTFRDAKDRIHAWDVGNVHPLADMVPRPSREMDESNLDYYGSYLAKVTGFDQSIPASIYTGIRTNENRWGMPIVRPEDRGSSWDELRAKANFIADTTLPSLRPPVPGVLPGGARWRMLEDTFKDEGEIPASRRVPSTVESVVDSLLGLTYYPIDMDRERLRLVKQARSEARGGGAERRGRVWDRFGERHDVIDAAQDSAGKRRVRLERGLPAR